MAQKTKTAARPSSSKAKPAAKVTKVKSKATPVASKSVVKTAVAPKTAPVAKAMATAMVKTPAKPVKPVKASKAGPQAKPAVAVPVAAVDKPQIEKAKAALKKESAAASGPTVATKPESKTRARRISIDINPNEAASALAAKWTTLYKKAEQIEAKPYNMKAVFEEKTAIVHKVLGWGYILTNRNDRLEVLFKDGIKYLISNYKPG